MYQIPRNNPFYVTLKYFQCLLYYPVDKSPESLKIYRFASRTVRVLTFFGWVLNMVHLFLFSLKEEVYEVIADDMIMGSGLFGCMFACIFFFVFNNLWMQIFDEMIDFCHYGKPPGFDEVQKYINKFSLICILYCNCGGAVYAYIRTCDKSCETVNVERGVQDICNVVLPIWLPLESVTTKTKYIINAYQVLCLVAYIPPAALLCTVPWACTQILGTRIDHLNKMLTKVFDEGSDNDQDMKLNLCIKYHIHILRMCSNLSNAVKKTLSHICIIAALILGCILTQMLRKFQDGELALLIGWIVTPLNVTGSAVFFLCHAGQTIKDKTVSIGQGAYSSKWYQCNPRLRSKIQMVILRANKPMPMEAIPFGHIDYALFFIIVKTSYTYLNLLNAK